MSFSYERILLVKNECFVYRLPPRPSNKGYKAADWGLDKPHWTGRLRVIVVENLLTIKLETREGQLFAKAPVDTYPGVAVESVTDSSRYFVLRIMDDTGRKAFVGVGFADRGDAFDFNVTLQDHFKKEKNDQQLNEIQLSQPSLNLELKEGETLKIKLGNKTTKSKSQTAKPKPLSVGLGGLLPPPPSNNTAKEEAPNNNQWGEFASSSTSSDWVQF